MKSRLHIILFFLLIPSCFTYAQGTNYALQLDGVNDYVAIPHNTSHNVSAVTIEMWMYWENTTNPADVDFLIGKGLEELEIHTGGGSGVNGLRFIPTDKVYLDSRTNVFAPGTWTHIAFIYDPGSSFHKCYINGNEEPLTFNGFKPTNTPISQSGDTIRIGARTGGDMYFQGKLDELRIWNVVRSQADISSNMNRELNGNESGLIAYYKMNSIAGNTLLDNVSGNNGTLKHGASFFLNEVLMPVELSSFTAKGNKEAVILNWETLTEVNNYGFEIQRTSNPSKNNWELIGFVDGNGNSNSVKKYSYQDNGPHSGTIYYRLKQLDSDGQFSYSDVVKVSVSNISETNLFQCKPNPFNPTTEISYEVPVKTFVTIKVYDISGREIASLVNQEKDSGSHSITWNGKDNDGQMVSTGVYFYRLTAGNNIITKKMMLLK